MGDKFREALTKRFGERQSFFSGRKSKLGGSRRERQLCTNYHAIYVFRAEAPPLDAALTSTEIMMAPGILLSAVETRPFDFFTAPYVHPCSLLQVFYLQPPRGESWSLRWSHLPTRPILASEPRSAVSGLILAKFSPCFSSSAGTLCRKQSLNFTVYQPPHSSTGGDSA